MDEYNKQAEKFLKETGTEFKVKFVKNGIYFDGDTEPRDIYLITLKRGYREFSFKFGQGINNTEKQIKPTAYDFLSCVEKYGYINFEDFCNEFVYDEDSRKAEKTFKAVQEEFNKIRMLFNDPEIEKLQEIQ